ncbi:MAG: HlyD family type I secretion periplasmic adaptor subunit [Gammaproteobacteria bacterium]
MAEHALDPEELRKAQRDRAILSDLRAATLADDNPLASLVLLLLMAILVAAYVWASRAVVDEMTIGDGKVIPSSREQVIQSLEGGILSELRVKEGDRVEAGQVLLRIDDTRFGASYREGKSRQDALRATIARLTAEASGGEPRFDDDLERPLVESEIKLFRSRRQALEEGLAALGAGLRLAQQELDMTAPLVAKGAVSEVEVLRLRREVTELRGRIQERRNTFQAEARTELAGKEAELAATAEINAAREDQVRRTVVRSPMRGTVKRVKVTTVGGVIGPGQDIMEIVPLEDRLLVEARIRPKDVAFLHPGQPATVKITAYDFAIYGGLKGRLEQISADTISDEKDPSQTYYRILVRTETSHLEGRDGPLPIIPGMTASVEVLTGHKTVLDYILKPVLKVGQGALHER